MRAVQQYRNIWKMIQDINTDAIPMVTPDVKSSFAIFLYNTTTICLRYLRYLKYDLRQT